MSTIQSFSYLNHLEFNYEQLDINKTFDPDQSHRKINKKKSGSTKGKKQNI